MRERIDGYYNVVLPYYTSWRLNSSIGRDAIAPPLSLSLPTCGLFFSSPTRDKSSPLLVVVQQRPLPQSLAAGAATWPPCFWCVLRLPEFLLLFAVAHVRLIVQWTDHS